MGEKISPKKPLKKNKYFFHFWGLDKMDDILKKDGWKKMKRMVKKNSNFKKKKKKKDVLSMFWGRGKKKIFT